MFWISLRFAACIPICCNKIFEMQKHFYRDKTRIRNDWLCLRNYVYFLRQTGNNLFRVRSGYIFRKLQFWILFDLSRRVLHLRDGNRGHLVHSLYWKHIYYGIQCGRMLALVGDTCKLYQQC